jgi:DNA-binding MarR family transcriptional regulator
MVEELTQQLHAAGYTDITAAHHPVFENIDRHGTRVTVLAARTGLTRQSVGELVDVLERRGYVERQADPTDGRATLVVLTDNGRTLVRHAIAEIREIETTWSGRYRSAAPDLDLRAVLESGLELEARAREGGKDPRTPRGGGHTPAPLASQTHVSRPSSERT